MKSQMLEYDYRDYKQWVIKYLLRLSVVYLLGAIATWYVDKNIMVLNTWLVIGVVSVSILFCLFALPYTIYSLLVLNKIVKFKTTAYFKLNKDSVAFKTPLMLGEYGRKDIYFSDIVSFSLKKTNTGRKNKVVLHVKEAEATKTKEQVFYLLTEDAFKLVKHIETYKSNHEENRNYKNKPSTSKAQKVEKEEVKGKALKLTSKNPSINISTAPTKEVTNTIIYLDKDKQSKHIKSLIEEYKEFQYQVTVGFALLFILYIAGSVYLLNQMMQFRHITVVYTNALSLYIMIGLPILVLLFAFFFARADSKYSQEPKFHLTLSDKGIKGLSDVLVLKATEKASSDRVTFLIHTNPEVNAVSITSKTRRGRRNEATSLTNMLHFNSKKDLQNFTSYLKKQEKYSYEIVK